MLKHAMMTVGLIFSLSTLASAQVGDGPFQMRALATLKAKDAIVVSNSGASSTVANPQNGSLCANVYALSATTGLLLGCCSCQVRPDAAVSIPIMSDVLGNPKPKPKEVVIKLMATTGTSGVCNPTTPGTGADVFVTGMTTWKGESPLTNVTLSAAELGALTGQCTTLQPTGNICPVCVPPIS